MEANDRRQDLSELHADALTAERMDSALLLRYADDPAALGEDERSQVEAYLAESPARRDELGLLARLTEARAAGPSERGSEEQGGGSPSVVRLSSHPRWQKRAAIATALAASLVLVLLYAVRDADEGPGLQVVQEDPLPALPAEEARAPELVPAPMLDEEPTELAQETGDVEPTSPEPTPEPKTEPQHFAAADPAPVAPSHEEAIEAPQPEPIVVAMNFTGPLDYVAPAGATYLEPLGVLRNASEDLPTLQALVPDHVARTVEASPTLYWFLSEDFAHPVEFVLADRVSIDPALELVLEPPLRAGIHALRLADHNVELQPGMPYRWFVSLSSEHLTRGGIERVMQSSELEARLTEAAPGDRGKVYAAAGLWYEALAFISAGIERAPDDARLRELRADLLEQAGHERPAAYDRAAVSGASWSR